VHIGHLGIEDDYMRVGLERTLERLLSRLGAEHPEPVWGQYAIDRPSRPFLIIGDEHPRFCGFFAISHGEHGLGVGGIRAALQVSGN
jgi:hypothetical protein